MARGVERLKALTVSRLAEKPGLHNDGAGLGLRVTPPWASWVLRYMLDGKAREMGLGRYPDVSLAEARVRASEARKLKGQGIDPIEAREAERARKRVEAAKSVTFRYCAEAYIGARKDSWKNPKHRAQWEATLETYAMPIIGNVPVQAVDVPLVHKILSPIWNEKPETASRLRGRIEAVLDWAKTRGFRSGDNPARWKGHLENLFPARSKVQKTEHHPALPYSEMGTFMQKVSQHQGVASLALRFTILTAARTGEVINARWNEFDLNKKIWTIPATRMKASREHRVPLTEAALGILAELGSGSSESGHVFVGNKGRGPISNMAMLQLLRRMGRADLTVHGFRSSFRDWAAEQTAYPREVAEAALAHVVGDKVEAAYLRGDFFEKRRKLMDAWATYCSTTTSEGSVIPIRAKK